MRDLKIYDGANAEMAKQMTPFLPKYKQDYCEGIYSTDFLIERDGKRIAVESKANVERDPEKTYAMTELLKVGLSCGRVLVIVLYHDDGMPHGYFCVSDIESILLQ